MYPDDELVTSFIEPIWYNITSFDDEIEKWWYVIVAGGYVGVEELDDETFQIYPNPCSGTVSLRYQISDIRYQISDLYSISGLKIRGLVNEIQKAGEHEMVVDVSDLSPGVYFIRFLSGNQIITRKLVIH